MSRRAIQLLEVVRRYRTDDVAALRTVSLSIGVGEFVAVTGASGSGKSTLLNILGLLDRPTSGTYRLFGEDTSRFRGRRVDDIRGLEVGFVFQSSYLLPDRDVMTNVQLGLRCLGVRASERQDRARAALETVGLQDRALHPAKLLSGGERQRAAIARALAAGPRLILADEPTGNLDSANSQQVMRLLREAHERGTTVVMVTHDVRVANLAERVITLHDGVIVDDVRPRESAPSVGRLSSAVGRRRHPSARDALDDAVLGLASRASRAVLLLMAFALGIAGLLGSLGLSTTAASQVAGRLTAASTDQFYVYPDTAADARSMAGVRAMTTSVRRLSHVAMVGAFLAVPDRAATVSRGFRDRDASVVLRGGTAEYAAMAVQRLVPAHAASQLDNGALGPVAIVSRKAADELAIPYGSAGPGRGATVVINGVDVPVVGVFDASARAPELTTGVIVSLGLVIGVAHAELGLAVVTEPGFPAAVAAAVPFAVAPGRPAGVQTETVADLQGLRIGVSQDLATMVAVIGAIVLIVAALGAATTLRLSVEARTAEIALRRAVGATRAAVASLFLWEGIVVGAVGGALGALLGQCAVLAVSAGRNWTPVLPIHAWWLGIVLGLATGLASGAQPAWRAGRKDPALAMRE